MLTNAIRKKLTMATAGVAMAVLSLAPIGPAYALSPSAAPTPTDPTVRTTMLERAWLRLRARHDRLGVMFDHVQQRINLGQRMIDQAKANGKDVTSLQSALDEFSNAVQQARPTYGSMQGIISSHQGFDSNGNVTDATMAAATVRDMQEKFLSIQDVLSGPAQALRDAVRAFRQANQASS